MLSGVLALEPAIRQRSSVAREIAGSQTSPKRIRWWRSPRGATWIGVTGAVAACLIMVLSSALPPIGSWHSQSGANPVPLTAASLPNPSQISSYYPYVASPSKYPQTTALSAANPAGPVALESSAGCSGPVSLSAGSATSGTLAPNGCSLYTINITEATWQAEAGKSLDAIETDLPVSRSAPTYAIFEDIGTASSPSKWILASSLEANASIAVPIRSSDDSINVQGGWGLYEFALVSSPSSYGAYCLVLTWSGTSCSSFGAQIGLAAGQSGLAVNFSAKIADGSSPYTFKWTF